MVRVVLIFFKMNFWFWFLIIVEDIVFYDRFFGEVILLNYIEFWIIFLFVVSKKMIFEGFYRQLYNYLVEDIIVFFYFDFLMVVLIFKLFLCSMFKKVRWFIIEKGYIQNILLIKLYLIGFFVMVLDFVMLLDDVILDSVLYLNLVI